jgi:hypothetical protein
LVRPDTTHDVATGFSPTTSVEHDPPGAPVTTYPVTALPPSEVGAVHDTVTSPSPATPVTPVGAPGTVRGVTDPLAELAAPAPATFEATTVNVCPVPLVRPDTTHDVATGLDSTAAVEHDPDGEPVTTYPVTALPPSDVGGVHDTVT